MINDAAIKDIVRDIDQHLADLHLLFTNDVTFMNLQKYTKVTLTLIKARAELEVIDSNYKPKLEIPNVTNNE